jgi:hypothetical protein
MLLVTHVHEWISPQTSYPQFRDEDDGHLPVPIESGTSRRRWRKFVPGEPFFAKILPASLKGSSGSASPLSPANRRADTIHINALLATPPRSRRTFHHASPSLPNLSELTPLTKEEAEGQPGNMPLPTSAQFVPPSPSSSIQPVASTIEPALSGASGTPNFVPCSFLRTKHYKSSQPASAPTSFVRGIAIDNMQGDIPAISIISSTLCRLPGQPEETDIKSTPPTASNATSPPWQRSLPSPPVSCNVSTNSNAFEQLRQRNMEKAEEAGEASNWLAHVHDASGSNALPDVPPPAYGSIRFSVPSVVVPRG